MQDETDSRRDCEKKGTITNPSAKAQTAPWIYNTVRLLIFQSHGRGLSDSDNGSMSQTDKPIHIQLNIPSAAAISPCY